MIYLLFLPFLLQGILILIDEFYFHFKRGLPRWERLGHPLDTLSMIIPLGYVLLHSFDGEHLKIFLGLSIFSSLFVTKDEFVHTQYCVSGENWIHSLLFVLHPLVFLSVGLLWMKGEVMDFLFIQTLAMTLFMIYQIVFWSLIWKPKAK